MCEKAADRNYQNGQTTVGKGALCVGPTDCMPGNGACGSTGLPGYAYGAIAVGSILVLAGLAYRQGRKQSLKRLLAAYSGGNDDGDGDDTALVDISVINRSNKTDYFDPQMTLKRKFVKLDKVIGEGNFGKVYSGTVKDPQRGGIRIPVAIKAPSTSARIEFESEMEIMSQITRLGGHEHIVSVVGCVYGKEPLLALELCAGGSLKGVLEACRTSGSGGDDSTRIPTVEELTTFGHHVALAMTFLEYHKLLHRDLAARNVLLTDQRMCKLADFGLSRTVGASDYYRRTTGASAPIPVRWMAPETLDFNVSTIMSDRWSYAVLLWELYSLAARPYAGVTNAEVANCIRTGHRLEQPKLCPDAVYTLMLECWAAEPKERPPFAQVADQLYSTLAVSGV